MERLTCSPVRGGSSPAGRCAARLPLPPPADVVKTPRGPSGFAVTRHSPTNPRPRGERGTICARQRRDRTHRFFSYRAGSGASARCASSSRAARQGPAAGCLSQSVHAELPYVPGNTSVVRCRKPRIASISGPFSPSSCSSASPPGRMSAAAGEAFCHKGGECAEGVSPASARRCPCRAAAARALTR
jgi:hypothetical protein